MKKLNFDLVVGDGYNITIEFDCQICTIHNKCINTPAKYLGEINGEQTFTINTYCPNCGQRFTSWSSKGKNKKTIRFHIDRILSTYFSKNLKDFRIIGKKKFVGKEK
jgi:hypothetical protein